MQFSFFQVSGDHYNFKIFHYLMHFHKANMAFMALLAAKTGLHPTENRKWAKSQIGYALGDTGRSFVVGFGINPPTRLHHKESFSSCPVRPVPCSWDYFHQKEPNPHILYGALVGGPDQNDKYTDNRENYVNNEVACDYNASLQAAVADTCKAPYQRIADGCYYFSTENVARDSAAYAGCVERGGYLAIFETLEEAMLVKNELLRRNKGLFYYVGGRNLNRNNPEGDWRWIKKGEMLKMAYFIFPKGQPNGSPEDPQDCMGFDPYLHYNLNDLYCDNSSASKHAYICEQ